MQPIDAEATCPHCQQVLDRHVGTDPRMRTGDCSFCFFCGGLSVIERTPETLSLRLPTVSEQAEFDKDLRLIAMTQAWLERPVRS